MRSCSDLLINSFIYFFFLSSEGISVKIRSLSPRRTQTTDDSTQKHRREGRVLISDRSKMKQAVQTEWRGIGEGLLTKAAFEETRMSNGSKSCLCLGEEHSRLWEQQRKP